MDTKIRLTSYQLESSVRTKQYTLKERILEQYKALLDEQYEINQEKGDVLLLEREEYSSIIRNNTDLMLNLVNDVLDLSRMETGDLHFNIKDYPLLECCQMALESVRYRMPDRVKLIFSPAGEPIVVHVDNLRLQQLLTNLLTNAAKFTEKGEINLSFQLAPDREKVCIAVTDTGAGIPLEKQAAVFNRFEKLDDYKPGAGLGLSICLLIAERLNGALSIDSSIYNPQIEG